MWEWLYKTLNTAVATDLNFHHEVDVVSHPVFIVGLLLYEWLLKHLCRYATFTVQFSIATPLHKDNL